MGLRLILVFLMLTTPGVAQENAQQSRRITPPFRSADEFVTNKPVNVPTSLTGANYQIGRDDLIEVTVFEVPELSTTGRVSASGLVSLPLVGAVQVAGKTTQELETVVEEALKTHYVINPHVTVLVREYASQPVSVVGAVKAAGIYQIKGQKFLLDMLATAQGLDQATAGKTIQVIRRGTDSGDPAGLIIIDVEDLFEKGKTEANIPIEPGDVINVSQAGSIFVVGEVARPGEFVLRRGKDISASQAVALGAGFTRDAKKKDCLIIRVHSDKTKEEIPVNIEKILDGSLNDVALIPNDILFVPANKVKVGLSKALDTSIAVVSGRLIYGF